MVVPATIIDGDKWDASLDQPAAEHQSLTKFAAAIHVTDRFRLWAIGTLAAVLISSVGIVYRALGLDFQGSAIGGITIGTLGLVTAASFWLAFLPPAAYRRHVAARAPAA